MADKVKGIVIDIGGDVSKLNKSLSSVNKSINYTQKELKDIEKLLKLDPKNTELLAQKQQILNNIIAESNEKLKSLKKAKNEADVAMKNGTEVNQDMYRKLQREIINTESKLKSLSDEASKLTKFANNLNNIGEKTTQVGKNLMPLTAGIVATGVAAVKTGIDFETAFAGVRKTTEATEEEYARLKQGILDMSKELPASASEIAGVAESAGQLGISKDNLLDFTRVMIDLGESTNLSSEEVATSLAKFANITNMSADKYSNLGSTIVALGNNFATTEADIVSMATKLASTGELVGLSEPQIMALATTMSSVGIEAEAGGSAMSKLLKKIQMAVEIGGKDLTQFANVAGMTAQEFKSSFEQDAVRALSAFIGGLNDTKRNGKSAIAILDDMGLTEVRLSNTVLSLANANDLMTNAVNLANNAWQENTALSKEAEQRYATTASKINMLGNKIKEIGIKIAEELLPMVNEVVEVIGKWVDKFSKLDDRTQRIIVLISGIVATIGPLLIMIGSISKGISTIITVTKSWEIATKAQTIAQGALNLVTSLTPYGVVALGIAGVVAGLGIWMIKTSGQTEEQQKLNQVIDEANRKYEENTKLANEQISTSQSNAATAKILTNQLYELAEAEDKDGLKKEKMKNLVEQLNDMIPNLNLAINSETGELTKQKDEVVELTDNYYNLAIAKAYAAKISAEATKIADAEEARRLAQEQLTTEKKVVLQKMIAAGYKQTGEAYRQAGGYLEETIAQANTDIAIATSNMKAYQDKAAELTASLKENDKEVATSSINTTNIIASNVGNQMVVQKETAKTAKEISQELLATYEKEVSDKKFYNQMSIAEELEYWEQKRNVAELGAEELEEVNKKAYTARNELSKSMMQTFEQYASEYYKDNTEAEIEYWKTIRRVSKLGTEDVMTIDKKLYSLRKAMSEEEQKEREEATKRYNEQLTSRADALRNFNGIFNELNEQEDISGKELLKRLKDQVKEFEKWQKDIEKLSKRGLDIDILDELKETGPNSLNKVEALLSLSDKQIDEYSSQYKKLGKLANEQAISELGPLETSLSNIKGTLSTLNEDIAYAIAPTSTLVNKNNSQTQSVNEEEKEHRLFELITQLIVEGGNKVAESVFAAIPDYVKMIINGQELAAVTWKDFEREANRHGKNWFTRDQVASIARSVMPRSLED